MTDPTDLGPATPSIAQRRQRDAVSLMRDVWGGTRTMRERGRIHLPQFPKEADTAYRDRLARSVLFNATKRTIKGVVGIMLRQDPEIGEDVPTQIAEHLDNVDLMGRPLNAFTRDFAEDAMIDGHAGIFVDMTPPIEAESLADEIAAGIRPYWVAVRKGSILRASSIQVGGRMVLTSLAFRETSVERTTRFGEREVDRVREYEVGTEERDDGSTVPVVVFRTWTLDPEKEWPGEGIEDWTVTSDATLRGMSRIPFAVHYTGRVAPMQSEPPFEDLAHLNVLHYQNESDNQNFAHTAKIPILTLLGFEKDEVETLAVGPSMAIVKADPSASVQFAQVSGEDLAIFIEDTERIEKRMALLGLSMLMSESRAAETAESKRIDKSESDAQLATIAGDLERTLNQALDFHGEWLGIDEPGTISVSHDFDAEMLSAGHIRELREIWDRDGFSRETFWSMLERGEIMPRGWSSEVEEVRLAREQDVRLGEPTL